jgi:hypothetical protein
MLGLASPANCSTFATTSWIGTLVSISHPEVFRRSGSIAAMSDSTRMRSSGRFPKLLLVLSANRCMIKSRGALSRMMWLNCG